MSESKAPTAMTAGALLRQAREAQGMSLDSLATLLKVPVQKLQALESDQVDQLPGLAFTRALAQNLCRQLHLDPTEVLQRLPQTEAMAQALEDVTRGLATPFREPKLRGIPGAALLQRDLPDWLRPSVIASAVLVLVALAFWFMPRGLFSGTAAGVMKPVAVAGDALGEVAQPVIATASAVLSAPSSEPVVETVHSVPEDEGASAPGAPQGAAVLRTTAESWIEVRDAKGETLLSRVMLPGESVGLEGALPLRLKIGNADGTRLSFHGQPVDLTAYTRDNVARVELK
jgi:cytoskeleton protein RodZ